MPKTVLLNIYYAFALANILAAVSCSQNRIRPHFVKLIILNKLNSLLVTLKLKA